jgi:prevent-host-death family protein
MSKAEAYISALHEEVNIKNAYCSRLGYASATSSHFDRNGVRRLDLGAIDQPMCRAAASLNNIGQACSIALLHGSNSMKQLNLAEAKARLSQLVDQAAKGRGVIIAKSGIPLAKLVPLDDVQRKPFKFGTLKGVLTDEVVEAIEAPLPDDVLDAMLNGPLDTGGRT